MIQLNLLPSIKQEFVRAERMKKLVMIVSGAVTTVCLIIFVILILVVNVFQKTNLNNIDKDIKTYTAKLKATPDLDQILTVQNQLNSLPALNSSKPAASRMFGYIKQLTPSKVDINSLDVDYVAFKITISGTADSADTVNTFVDTLKFTDYSSVASDGTKTSDKAFSSVVLTSFNKTGTTVKYVIDFNFDQNIFDNSNTTSLTIPNIISTRSEVNQPKALFQ